MSAADPATTEALAKILSELNDLKLRNAQLESKVRRETDNNARAGKLKHAFPFATSFLYFPFYRSINSMVPPRYPLPPSKRVVFQRVFHPCIDPSSNSRR